MVEQDKPGPWEGEAEDAGERLGELAERTDRMNGPQRSLLSLSWPIFIDISLHFSTLIINMMMVGAVSVEAVAELTVGNQVFDIILIIFNFINIGVCVVCAQALGAGNPRLVKRLVHQGMGMNIIIGIALFLLTYIFSAQIVSCLNVPAEIADSSENYLMILSLCALPQSLILVSASVLRAFECTRDTMYVSLIINVITVSLNSMFLFGYLGMPILGVEGVAVSTVIGRVVGAILCIYLVTRRTRIRLHPRFFFVFTRRVLSAIFNIGLPGASEHFAWQAQFMFMTAIVGLLGSVALATHGIYFQICHIIMIFAIAIAMGTEILVAHHVGALHLDLAHRQLVRSAKVGMLFTILITCSIPFGTGQFLVSMFTDSADVMAVVAPILILTLVMEPGRIINIIIINALRATGDTRFPLVMAVISMWGVSVPLGTYLGLETSLGLLGVWIGFCADEWVRAIAMIVRWKSGKWREKARENHEKHLSIKAR